jgi:DNA-binding protein H-NS
MKSVSEMSMTQLIRTKTEIEAEIISRVSKGANGHQKGKKLTPSFQNPKNPSETWVGRGRRPYWLATALKRGKKLSDFALH